MSNARDKANIPSLNFSSTGIDDNANALAITIDSSEHTHFGLTSSPSAGQGGVSILNYGTIQSSRTATGNLSHSEFYNPNGQVGNIKTSGSDLNINASSSLTFYTNNAEKMRILADGKVGIGTSNPSCALDVNGGSANGNVFKTTTSGDNNYLAIDNTSTGGQEWVLNSSGNGSGNGGGAFAIQGPDSNTPRLLINSSGQVGIGTSSPSKPLEIVSSAQTTLLHLNSTAGTTSAITFENTGSNDSITIGAENDDLKLRTDDGVIKFFTNENSEKMRIDSSGNVGIGTTSVQGKLHIMKNDASALIDGNADTLFLENTTSTGLTIGSATTGEGIGTSSPHTKLEVYNTSNGGVITAHRNSEVSGDYTGYEFHTNSSATQFKKGAIYFKASGNGYGRGDIVFCNDKVADGGNVGLADEKFRVAENGRLQTNATNNRTGHLNLIGERGSSYKAVVFEHTSDGGQIGTITTTSSAVSYNTSSDYRLKENVVDMTNATDRLKQLQPKRFNFISDADTTVDGFIAHEVSSVVPEAISGTHNEVEVWEEADELPDGVSVGDNKLDDDGNTIPKYQGIDQSKLVPLLVKTIQELEARITTLETNNP